MGPQRTILERLPFLIGSLVASLLVPIALLLALLVESKPDLRGLFIIVMGLLTIGFLTAAVVEFETDGLVAWVLGGVAQKPRFALGLIVGVILKLLAVVHGVAALSFGSMLLWESAELPRAFRSGLSGTGLVLGIAFVVWLWLMTAVSYLAGDGWMRRSRTVDRIEPY